MPALCRCRSAVVRDSVVVVSVCNTCVGSMGPVGIEMRLLYAFSP